MLPDSPSIKSQKLQDSSWLTVNSEKCERTIRQKLMQAVEILDFSYSIQSIKIKRPIGIYYSLTHFRSKSASGSGKFGKAMATLDTTTQSQRAPVQVGVVDASSAYLLALTKLLQLERKARAAASVRDLGFLIVNETVSLLPYRQSALWRSD